MAYQALYRKYRPQTFSSVVGQEHITETLKNELMQGKTVHAYLFTGTRGTGKTSCAKILARAVNCLSPVSGDPCLECESCRIISNGENTDIVEIDAASNNGVDSIRELREQINFAPAASKYRVYIIDEVHMLSQGAFNALLKTLEEPPEHVIFILATTEVHKLPATILSRCQRFDFRRIDSAKIAERIQYVAQQEGITVTDDAATLIAAAADGGMRDALSILDLCASGNKQIDQATVENVCAMAGNDFLFEMADYITKGDTQSALLMVDRLHSSSVDMTRLLADLTLHYRDLMIAKTVKSAQKPIVCSAATLKRLEAQADLLDIKDIMHILRILQDTAPLMQSGNRRSEMEMAIIKLCNPQLSYDLSSLEKRIRALEAGNFTPLAAKTQHKEESVEAKAEEIPLPDSEDIPQPYEAPQKPVFDDNPKPVEKWNEVVMLLKSSCPPIAGVLEGSKAYIKGAYLLIDAPNGMFRTMINNKNSTYKDSIRKAAQSVLGDTYKLGPYTAASKDTENDPLLALSQKLKNLETN